MFLIKLSLSLSLKYIIQDVSQNTREATYLHISFLKQLPQNSPCTGIYKMWSDFLSSKYHQKILKKARARIYTLYTKLLLFKFCILRWLLPPLKWWQRLATKCRKDFEEVILRICRRGQREIGECWILGSKLQRKLLGKLGRKLLENSFAQKIVFFCSWCLRSEDRFWLCSNFPSRGLSVPVRQLQ